MNEREDLFEVDKKHRFIPLNYLLPTYRGNVNYYKSVHHPIPTPPLGTGSTLSFFENKSVNSLFNCVSRYIFFFPKLKGKERPFGRVQEGGPHCNIMTWLIRDEI